MSKIFSIVLLLVGIFSVQESIAQVKMGHTNPAYILSQLPEVEEVNNEIEAIISERDAELADRAADLQQIFSEYESNMTNLSEQQRSAREEELMQLNQQFEEDRQSILNEVQQKRNELMRPIIERMNMAIKEVADEMELDLVLNEGTSNGDAIIFYANSEKLNITDQVVEKLK